MADISTWSNLETGNGAASPDGFPEGMAPSGTNNSAREVMAAVRRQWEDASWFNHGHDITRNSETQFRAGVGDFTSVYLVGRRVRAVGSLTGTIYGTITASTFTNPDTTVDVSWDSGQMESETITISVGTGEPSSAVGFRTLYSFGAVGDDSTDDKQALINAFSSPGIVFITAGTYFLDNTAEIELSGSDVRVIAEPGAVLRLGTDGMGIVLTGQDIQWSGGKIRGEGTVNTTTGTARVPALLAIDGDAHTSRANIVIENLDTEEANHTGILVYRATGVDIIGGYHEDDSDYTGANDQVRAAVAVNDCAYVRVRGITSFGFGQGVLGGGNAGGHLQDGYDELATSGLGREIHVLDCNCLNWSDHGIYFSDYASGLVVTGNTCVSEQTNSSDPIKLQGDWIVCNGNRTKALEGLNFRAARRQIATGNMVEVTATGDNVHGIIMQSVDTFAYDFHDFLVSGNILSATNSTGADSGILIYGLAAGTASWHNLDRIVVTDNIVQGYWAKIDATGMPSGIEIRVGEDNTTVLEASQILVNGNIVQLEDDHTVDNNGIFVRFNGNNLVVANNIVKGFNLEGISFDKIDTVVVDGNILAANPSAGASIGIRGEPDVANVRVGINHFRDCVTNFSIATATQREVAVLALNGSASVDLPSVALGGTFAADITVTGADPADPCVAAYDGDIEGMSISANCKSANTVEVVFNNNGPATTDPAAVNVFVFALHRAV